MVKAVGWNTGDVVPAQIEVFKLGEVSKAVGWNTGDAVVIQIEVCSVIRDVSRYLCQ